MQGRAELTLSTVVGQTQRLVDYTTDVEKVTSAIVSLSARPATQDGGQLLEGIFQAAKDQEKREAKRPVILAVTVGGEEHSTLPAHHVLDQLAKSGTRCTSSRWPIRNCAPCGLSTSRRCCSKRI